MRITIETLDGAAAFAQDLERLKREMAEDALLEIAHAGGDVVCESIADTVRRKAKTHPRGLLENSISQQPLQGFKGTIGVSIGWKETPVKASYRMTRTGRSGHLRRRKVGTIADIGGILEYSESRQLRHMEEGFDKSSEEAADVMQAAFDKLMEKALGK